MNINQNLRCLFEPPDWYHFSIDTTDTSAVHELPAQSYNSILRDNLKSLKLLLLPWITNVKDQLHQSIVCSLPEHSGTVFPSQCQVDRTKQKGFPRSGLPGKNIQSFLPLDLRLFNQRQIFYMQTL